MHQLARTAFAVVQAGKHVKARRKTIGRAAQGSRLGFPRRTFQTILAEGAYTAEGLLEQSGRGFVDVAHSKAGDGPSNLQKIQDGEMVQFSNGVKGMLLNLETGLPAWRNAPFCVYHSFVNKDGVRMRVRPGEEAEV